MILLKAGAAQLHANGDCAGPAACARPMSFIQTVQCLFPMLSHLTYRLKRLNRSVLAKMTLVVPKLGALSGAPVPLLKMEYGTGTRSRRLIIFLPGIDDLAEDFERRGFVHEMSRHGI
ncbi:hypothetical protein, partial [Noviherbaspirillum sp.]|uniref:hypothetical protein n=1 Tax=Noviherbaspirillum sp. TaxID=1926288 RepID=UPI002FE3C774